MVLDEARLHELLALALERMHVPDRCAAVLEGSIAEGFGNVSSDIDFLLIDESEEIYAGTPTVLFADGRRIEVRLRSTAQVAADRAALWQLGSLGAPAAGRIPADLLNRCQRLSRAFPLREHALVEAVQATMPAEELGAIASRAFAHRSRQCGRYAVALLTLDDPEDAAAWAETALTYGAKAWAALRDETYVETKWLAEQLRRARERGGEDAETVDRLRELLPRSSAGLPAAVYVERALTVLPELGVGGCGVDPDRVTLRRQPGVTTWPIAGQLHVLRDQRDVLVLNGAAARAWRRVVFERPLPTILDETDGEERRALAALHRLGLMRLAWRGGGTITTAAPVTPPPGAVSPPLTLRGATPDTRGIGITLVPIPARRFAAAGMALVWGNVMVENAREDALGARDHEQWGVLEAVTRRMLRRAALSVLSAHGVDPLPAQEEACARLAELSDLDRALVERVLGAERDVTIDGPATAEGAVAAVEDVVAQLRATIGAEEFPQSFLDADGWRSTLETFYDWVRIGAHLDSEFPLDDLRDVLLAVDRRRLTPAAG
jgi:hypothetical protein